MGKYTSKYTGQQIDDKLDNTFDGVLPSNDTAYHWLTTEAKQTIVADMANKKVGLYKVETISGTSGGSSSQGIAFVTHDLANKILTVFVLSRRNDGNYTPFLYSQSYSYNNNNWTNGAYAHFLVRYSNDYSGGNNDWSTTPTRNSTTAVTSGGVWSYVNVVKLAAGTFTSYSTKSIATLIDDGYSYIRLTGYSQYADKCQVDIVVKLSDVNSGTVEIDKAIPGWNDPLHFYVYKDSSGNLAWNGGESHAIYVTLIEGIK